MRKGKKENNQVAIDCTSRIVETISDFLMRSVDYAYMLDGLWGSGKTFFVNNILKEALKRKGYRILHVSLFGKVCAKDVTKEILSYLLFHQKTNETTLVKSFVNASISEDNTQNKKSRMGKIIINATSELMDYEFEKKLLQSKDRLLFVFDDVERCNITCLLDILGEINSRFIERGYHVLFVADESHLKKNSQYNILKEKIIRTTIQFKYDNIGSLLKEIISNRNDPTSNLYQKNPTGFQKFIETMNRVENLRTWLATIDYYNMVVEKCHFDDSYRFRLQLFAIIFITTYYMKTNPKLFETSSFSVDEKEMTLEKAISGDFGIGCFSIMGYGRYSRLRSQSSEMIVFGRVQSIIELVKSGFVDVNKIKEEMESYYPQGTNAELALVKSYSLETLSQEELETCLSDIIAGINNDEFDISKIINISRDFEFYDKKGYLSLYGQKFVNYKDIFINAVKRVKEKQVGSFFVDNVLTGYPYGEYLLNPNFLDVSLNFLSKKYDWDEAKRNTFEKVFSNIGSYSYTEIPAEVKDQMIEKVSKYNLFDVFLRFTSKDISQISTYLFDITNSVNCGDVYYSEVEYLRNLQTYINSKIDGLEMNKKKIDLLYLAEEIETAINKLESTRGKTDYGVERNEAKY